MKQPTANRPAQPPQRPGDRRLRRYRIGVAVAIALQLVIVFVGVGLAGGFREAPPRPLPSKQIGEPVDNGRFEFRVRRAWTADTDPTANPEYADKGKFLIVEMDMRLAVKDSLQFQSDIDRCLLLELPNGFQIDGDKSNSLDIRKGTVLASDLTSASLHPGIPERILAVYQLPAKQPLPKQLDLVIHRMEFTSGFFDETKVWRIAADDRDVAEIRLPVTRGRPA